MKSPFEIEAFISASCFEALWLVCKTAIVTKHGGQVVLPSNA